MPVYLISKDGQKALTAVRRMYGTHGPYMIGDYRLDRLVDTNVLVDSSTSTLHESGAIDSKTNTGSMLGRAVVGGVLLGGAGAAVGGVTASKNSTVNTTTTETKHVELTLKLLFSVGNPLIVIVKSLETYHWLLGQVGCREYDDAALAEAKAESTAAAEKAERWKEEAERWKQVDRVVQKPGTSLVTITLLLVPTIFGMWAGYKLSDGIFFSILLGILAVIFTVLFFEKVILHSRNENYQRQRELKYEEIFGERK